MSRLLQLLGIAFIILATCYAFPRNVRISPSVFGITLMVAMVVALVLIAARWWAGYSAMKRPTEPQETFEDWFWARGRRLGIEDEFRAKFEEWKRSRQS